MNFLCPACRTPLPRLPATTVLPCTGCGVEVDVARIETSPGQNALRADVDLAGETLGPYTLGERLGAGGMGVVYAAEANGERLAVKVLGGLLAADPSLRVRFRREAAALRAIEHPAVVRVVAEGEERGFCWYAMERVEGTDLRTRIKAGALFPNEVERIARALLDALATVHAAGFVHRDVKPGNVLLTLEGRPKLCDFGIAHVDGAATLTESAAILGSLRYMAPEQRLGRSSPQTDLYALGVTLHEALTGGSVPDEAPLPRDVPRRLRRLVNALTQLRAAERPKDAAAALAFLRPSRAARLAEAAGVQALAVVTSSARVGAIIAISLAISVAVGWVIARPRLQTATDSSPSFKPPPEFPGEVKSATKEPEPAPPAPSATPRPSMPFAPFPAEKKTFAEEMEAALDGAAGIDLNRRATVTPSGGVELPAGKPPAPKRTRAPTTTPTAKDVEPLPALEPAPLGETRAKPLDFEGRLQELDAKDPAKGASVRSKLETLDPAGAEAKRKKGSATAPRSKLPPRSNFKDDEDWLQAVDRLDPRTGSLLRAKLGK